MSEEQDEREEFEVEVDNNPRLEPSPLIYRDGYGICFVPDINLQINK